RREAAIAWLKRSIVLAPKNYWSQCYLAGLLDLAGRYDLALEHYGAAVALDPGRAWAHFNRARLYQQRNAWEWAHLDLEAALKSSTGVDAVKAHLVRGLVRQALGDPSGARADYEEVLARGAGTSFERAARLNRATLDHDAGADGRALDAYDRLLAED